jgi:ABC-type branched-subunit amino acid transport system ATPase component
LSIRQVEDRVVWVLNLFERLERRDRMRRAARLAGGKQVSPAVAQG